MGLDACVYCDCFEKGRLRESPPKGITLMVETDGSLGHVEKNLDLEIFIEWDRWREEFACEHPRGELLSHRLGNISSIGIIRHELEREPARFPILLTKVVYSGSHAGDFLPLDTNPALRQELELLDDFKCSNKPFRSFNPFYSLKIFKAPSPAAFVSAFRTQMLELVAASKSVNKPIVF
jgi:hypothetical protein